MDSGKILLVNLAKGKIGEDASSLLGALLVTKIGLAGLSRADVQEQNRPDFYLYMDEFQNFATLSLTNMLSELRKYRVNMVLAHQYFKSGRPKCAGCDIGKCGNDHIVQARAHRRRNAGRGVLSVLFSDRLNQPPQLSHLSTADD